MRLRFCGGMARLADHAFLHFKHAMHAVQFIFKHAMRAVFAVAMQLVQLCAKWASAAVHAL